MSRLKGPRPGSPGIVITLESTEERVSVETSNFVDMKTSKIKTMR